jgi:hypothetical protein
MQRIVDIVLQNQNFDIESRNYKINSVEYEQKEVINIDGKCPIIHYIFSHIDKKNRHYSFEQHPANYFGIKIGDLFKYFRSGDFSTTFDSDTHKFYKNVLKLELDYDNSPILVFGGISGRVVTKKIIGNHNYQTFANSTVVFANPSNLTRFSEKNLQNIVTEFVNSIHASINIASMQHLVDAYYMRNHEDDCNCIEFSEPKSLIDIIQVYHKDNKKINQFGNFLIKKSAIPAYQKEPYIHNPLIIKKWRENIIWGEYVSPEVLISAHFIKWFPRNMLEQFANIYMGMYPTEKNKLHRKIQLKDENNFSAPKFAEDYFIQTPIVHDNYYYDDDEFDEYTAYSIKNYTKTKGYDHVRYNEKKIRRKYKKSNGSKGFTEKLDKTLCVD